MPGLVADGDGAEEDRRRVVSVFSGAQPETFVASSIEEEVARVAAWIGEPRAEGVEPDEIGLFARTDAAAERCADACRRAGLPFSVRRGSSDEDDEKATVCTMALAKGLEFRAVAAMACDEDLVPLAGRLATAATAPDLDEVYSTERHLLYVACTRARARLLVSGVRPASEFLAEIGSAN